MTIISTLVASTISMISSTAFYETPAGQSLTSNQWIAFVYMVIIDTIIISCNIYIAYQYWAILHESHLANKYKITNEFMTRKNSIQWSIGGCMCLLYFYLNILYGSQLSNLFLGLNVRMTFLNLSSATIICV